MKLLILIVGASLFVWGGYYIEGNHPLLRWATILFFGACALAGAIGLLKGVSLRLDEQGFEMVGALKRARFLWKDIDCIRMSKIRGASVIALEYKNGHPGRSRVSRSLAGMDATIGGNIYEVSLENICAILKEWHERYGSST